jgi:hypothetical protein
MLLRPIALMLRLLIAARATASTVTASTTTASSCLRLVHADRAALDIASIEFLDRNVGSFVGRHFDETKATRAVGRAVHDYLGAIDWSGFRKRVLQILIRDSPGQIPYVQSAAH